MKTIIALSAAAACVTLVLGVGGCKKDQPVSPAPSGSTPSSTSTPTSTRSTSRPASGPVHMVVAPRPLPPDQAIAAARQRYPQELTLLRKHPWRSAPSADVLIAARRVFAADATAVQFVGLTPAQVKSLVGNPKTKTADNGQPVWVYTYAGGTEAKLKFADGVVAAQAATPVTALMASR